MRLFLLVSALGAAHAQLSSTSPWPMQGQNLRHTANGLVGDPGNSVVVLKYQVPVGPSRQDNRFIDSSPAVGADGTVYIGLQYRYGENLHAVNADGTPKWKYKMGAIQSSPAVGADGTVYVGSDDTYLHAVNADGTPKWKYPTGGSVLSSPAVGADGTVYVGSCDTYFYAVNADGTPKWKYKIGNDDFYIRSSPALGADGTVYVGSSYLYGFGLSAGYVTSLLHSALSALVSFKTESAVPKLQHLCDFKSAAIHGESSEFDDSTVKLIDTSCQVLANTRNSPSHGHSWKSFVTPLSFTAYQGLISAHGTMMTLLQSYEAALHEFTAEETTIDDRIATAKDAVKGYEADKAHWQDVIKRDKADMSAYGTEIVTIGQQMNSKYKVLQTDVLSLIKKLDAKLQKLKKDLVDAKDEDERKKAWSIFSAIFKVVKAAVSVAACVGESVETAGAALLACGKESTDAIKGAVSGVKDCVNTLKSSCKKCNELSAEIQEAKHAEQEINTLAGMVKASQALNAQLSTGKDLPEELPLLISESISMHALRADAELFRQELVKEAGADGGGGLVNDIDDWTELGVTRVSLFLSYYNLATRVQNNEGQLTALQARTNIVQDRLEDEQNKEAAVISAAYLMYERQQKQAILIIKYLYEEVKQYEYFSLKTLLPPIELSGGSQSEDILFAQQRIDQVYTDEMAKQSSGRNLAWIYIEVNEAAEPSTLDSMRKSASTSVVLPIPLKSDPNPATNAAQLVADTTYNQMRIHNVAVYLLDQSGLPLGDGPVQVELGKSGISSFFDSNMALHTFTHAPVRFGAGSFVYDSKTGCPLSEDDCGALCAKYIRYSPFGKWNVAVDKPMQQGVDLSKLVSIRFEFQVDYGSVGYSPNFFGKDPKRYPQNFGTRCLPRAEKDAASNENKDEI